MKKILFLLLMSQFCIAGEEFETAKQIIDKMDEIQRLTSDSAFSKLQLSSCKYAIKAKKLVCTEKPRIKVMESVSIQTGEDKKDSKGISIILDPANERGIGMLTYSYDDENRDTESWLYLSALGRVKRMASGTGEDQEPVSVFGSEFTTEDLENGKTDEYDYKILQEGPYSGREVWVIEAIPGPKRLRKTFYSKLRFWVDKERLIPLKMEAFNKRGDLNKRLTFKDFELKNGLWLSRNATVMNVLTKRMSNMKTLEFTLGVDIPDEFLTQRTLTDFAYREKQLDKLRKSVN